MLCGTDTARRGGGDDGNGGGSAFGNGGKSASGGSSEGDATALDDDGTWGYGSISISALAGASAPIPNAMSTPRYILRKPGALIPPTLVLKSFIAIMFGAYCLGL